MSMTDCERCFASRERGTIIDVLHPTTGLTVCYGRNLANVREEYPDAEEMSVEEFCVWKAERQRTPITWEPSTEERFEEMLCVLPPAAWDHGAGGFLVGEPYDHDAGNGQPRYQGFREFGGKYYQSSRPMTRAEFKNELTTGVHRAA